MLIIRDAQMRAFQQHQVQGFARKLAAYVRRREPALVTGWSDAQLERGLLLARGRAAGYGIADPLAIAEIFVAMATHALDFDAHPAIQAILRDEAIAPDHRIHVMWSRTTAETWAEIALAGADRGPWQLDGSAPR